MPCRPMARPARRGRFLAALILLPAAILSASAISAGLQVAPTTIDIPADRSATGLFLTNNGDRPLHAQVRVFRWTQADGQDLLEPSSDLAISPPMLELPAGGEQLVRVIRLGPPPAAESSYRVVVDELPLEDPEGAGGEQAQLRFVLRYSIPVFLGAPDRSAGASPRLHARLTRTTGERELEVRNSGAVRAQLSDLAHVAPDGARTVIAPGLSGYVLPGQWRRWTLPSALPAEGGSYQARINGEAESRALALDD